VRTPQETHSINRVLKARGLPTLDQPGVVEALARQVDDHQHFMELLRACDPALRRDAYEAMRPHLTFTARPLEDYIIAAKQHAEAAELPVMDEYGFLKPYSSGVITTIEIPAVELRVVCSKCSKEAIFLGAFKGDAIFTMRSSGWAFDESVKQAHVCSECLDGVVD
jgi:hypothetical protein